MFPTKFPAVFLTTVFLLVCAAVHHTAAEVRGQVFGQTAEGRPVEVFTLTNSAGFRARVMTWGATLLEMSVPDRAGKFADVTLGFETLDPYQRPHPFFGSTAGRYANRIAKGRFTLDGRQYELATNNGANHLHGGRTGFDRRNWTAEAPSQSSVRFRYVSPDGEEGYPGTLTVSVTYSVTEANELRIDYEAQTDAPTVLNPANHAYWNLAGEGDVLGHELTVNASRVTAIASDLIPTGELTAVAGTPLDFSRPKKLGRDIAAPEFAPFGGFDHNFVIDRQKGQKAGVSEVSLAAVLHDPASGRVMEVWTDQPGVQLYTGNGLGNVTGKGGRKYPRHGGVCLETQHFPDSPNHPHFPSTVLRPGETFRSTTIHRFSVR